MEVLPGDLTWSSSTASRQEVLEYLVAEAVKQLLHDTFVDTTWPACPRHRQHPLWLGEGEGGGIAWCCPRDRPAIAPLVGVLVAIFVVLVMTYGTVVWLAPTRRPPGSPRCS